MEQRRYAFVLGEALIDLSDAHCNGDPVYRQTIGGAPLNVADHQPLLIPGRPLPPAGTAQRREHIPGEPGQITTQPLRGNDIHTSTTAPQTPGDTITHPKVTKHY